MFPEANPMETLSSRGNETHCCLWGQCFVIPPDSKIEKNCEEIVCLTRAGSQICYGFKEHALITCESKVQVVVSLGG